MDKFNYACTYAYVRCTNAFASAKNKLRKRVDAVVNDESGMEIIAIILILVIVLALVIIFREQIGTLVENIWNKIWKEVGDTGIDGEEHVVTYNSGNSGGGNSGGGG